MNWQFQLVLKPISFIKKLGRDGLEFVPRDGWGALDGENYSEEDLLNPPVSNVRVAATGGPEDMCGDVSQCALVLRRIQKEHKRKCSLPDIAYNFMVGGDGRVYEGRGWDFKPYRSEEYCDHVTKSVVDLVYIGDFNKYARPPDTLQTTMRLFIEYSVEEKKIKPDYTEYLDYEEMY